VRNQIITGEATKRRIYWIDEIAQLSGNFGADSSRVEEELADEIKKDGIDALLDHLRLCSAIPESYGHDSSEEKLYSKYTDALISEAYSFLGLDSRVLSERADAADVEVAGADYSFVADAKVFRLSRTAKNQKDFKIAAMDTWKRGKPYAMVVCPLYQFPKRTSQIYQQAAARNVCIFSYSHLAVLVQLAEHIGSAESVALLKDVFRTVEALNPSKEANAYWLALNKTILEFDSRVAGFWKTEKVATLEGINVSKELALNHFDNERASILNLSREEAIKRLIDMNKIDSRAAQIERISDNRIMTLE